MVTKLKLIINSAAVILLLLLNFYCKKENTCPKLGYEFTYSKPGVIYTPADDSIPLGNSLTLEASCPKSFLDEEKQVTVILNTSSILGPLRITKATGSVAVPFTGAIEDVEITPLLGYILKDSINFSQGQLASLRTSHWDGSSLDSFRLKIKFLPRTKGVFFINLGQQGNKDQDCALYKYFIKVKNSDQHLYFLAQANNGYVDDYSRNYTYCFKVY